MVEPDTEQVVTLDMARRIWDLVSTEATEPDDATAFDPDDYPLTIHPHFSHPIEIEIESIEQGHIRGPFGDEP